MLGRNSGVFVKKQQASSRDLQKRSRCLFSIISLLLSPLPVKKLKKEPRGFRRGRSFVMSIFEHWEWPDAFFLVSTRHQNSNSPIQDYVHPDDQTQPTFLLGVYSHFKRSGMFCRSQWKVCCFKLDIFQTHFLIFYFNGELGTMKVHDA